MTAFDRSPQALFEAARGGTEPNGDDRQRIRRALAARLAGAAALGSSAAAGATTAGAAGAAVKVGAAAAHGSLFGKLVTMALLGAAAGGGSALVYHGVRSTARTQPSAPVAALGMAPAVARQSPPAAAGAPILPSEHPPAPAPPDRAAATPLEPAANAVAAAPRPGGVGATGVAGAPSRRTASAEGLRAAGASPGRSALEDEVALIARMQHAWRDGRLTDVSQAIAEHERRFAGGTLAEEREAMQAMLRCRGATPGRAQSVADDFVARYPASAHANRVQVACSRENR